jgi:hypothetical protein
MDTSSLFVVAYSAPASIGRRHLDFLPHYMDTNMDLDRVYTLRYMVGHGSSARPCSVWRLDIEASR